MEADTSPLIYASFPTTLFQNDLFLQNNGSGRLKIRLIKNFDYQCYIITWQNC